MTAHNEDFFWEEIRDSLSLYEGKQEHVKLTLPVKFKIYNYDLKKQLIVTFTEEDLPEKVQKDPIWFKGPIKE